MARGRRVRPERHRKAMVSLRAVLRRCGAVLVAAAVPLALSACSSEPAQLGTPAYALQRLFSPGPYRSTDQMLAAIKPAAEGSPATTETPSESGASPQPPADVTGAPGVPGTATTIPPAAVTFIQLNEYPLAPPSYPFAYPWYARPYGPYPSPCRPLYPQPYGPGGYRRCFGGCSGLNVSIGAGNSRINLNAGYAASSSTSRVLLRSPSTIAP